MDVGTVSFECHASDRDTVAAAAYCEVMSGTLIVCSTPIGNLGDMSERLIASLRQADIVYAEDTRRTAKLLAAVGSSVPVRSYFLGNERQRAAELGERLSKGDTVVLVSDAGTPVVSDPGLSAVRAAERAGATITMVPGPSAVTAILAVSGMSGDRFVFEGFLPRKGDERTQRLSDIAGEQRTVVFFTSGTRLHGDLQGIAELCDPRRQVVIGRELTKLHEQIWRGTLGEAVVEWNLEARGEITVALAGASTEAGSMDDAVRDALSLIDSGMAMSEAVKTTARHHHLKRSDVYDAVLGGRKAP